MNSAWRVPFRVTLVAFMPLAMTFPLCTMTQPTGVSLVLRARRAYQPWLGTSYFRNLELPLEEKVAAMLERFQLGAKTSPVFIQSFELSSLERLRALTKSKLVFLTSRPADVTQDRLSAIRRLADGIGVEKRLILPSSANGAVGPATSLIKNAHAAGLFVHVWTLRSEPNFLPAVYNGKLEAEAVQFARLGVDGIFTDFPDLVVSALRKSAPSTPTARR